MARSIGTRYPRGGSAQWSAPEQGATVLDDAFFGTNAPAPVNGSLSVTLGDATLSAAGTIASAGGPVVGTLSQTLGAATLSSAARLAVRAQLAGTLGAATSTATGRVLVRGTLAASLGEAILAATGEVATPAGPVAGSLTATLGDATLAAQASNGEQPTGPTPAGRGSNLRDIWEFRERPFTVRVKGKRKAYKTARQAATAVKEALRSAPADAVSIELEGQPVTLPALEFAPFRDVLARLMVLEQRREQAAENHRKAQAAERERIRRAQEADDEEALVLLLRAWRL